LIPVTLDRRPLPEPDNYPVWRDSQAPEGASHPAPRAGAPVRPATRAARMPRQALARRPWPARDRRCPAHPRAARESVPGGGIPACFLQPGAAPACAETHSWPRSRELGPRADHGARKGHRGRHRSCADRSCADSARDGSRGRPARSRIASGLGATGRRPPPSGPLPAQSRQPGLGRSHANATCRNAW